ncbi:MAG: metal ABC transporter permease [Anaerolineae bacterium]|nr:metal ABC transporter permease [Anaerolineae bacterium]
MTPEQFLYELFGKPLSYEFMQRAFAAALLIGVVAGVIGCFIVIRGMAFLTDALSHAVLPGVAVAFVLGWPLALGAFVMGAISAFIIGFLTRGSKIKEDTAIGIVFTSMFALGIAIISAKQRGTPELTHILVGDILAVDAGQLIVIAISGAVILGLVLALYKELVLTNFDPGLARTLRLPGETLRYLLLLMITLTIVMALQVIGVILIAAMLITPAAAASLLAKRLPTMMLLAALIGALGGVIGVWLAWHLNAPASAMTVLTYSAAFMLAFLFAPERGLLRRAAPVPPPDAA